MFHVYQKLPMFLIYIWCTWYDKKFIYYNCSECYHCSSRTWCTSVLNNVFITFFCQIVLIDLNHVLSVPDVTILPGCLKTSMIRSHLVKKHEQAYILSVPDVMDVLTSLITTTIDMVSSKYVSIVLDVTIVLKSSQLFLKRIWWICSSCTWCASVPHSIIMNRLLSVFIDFC